MKRKLPIIIAIIIILYAAIFATIMLITIFRPAAVYNDQKLLAGIDSANKMNYRLNIHDETTTVKCSKMTGADTIWNYNADNDMNLKMLYTFQVTDGKAKLILVNPDDTIIILAEQDSAVASEQNVSISDDPDPVASAAESMAVLDLKKGVNRIKIACEKGTSFSLSFTISE